MEGERWTRGNKLSLTTEAWTLSASRRSFHHLINSSSRSRGVCAASMSAQQYLLQCVHKLISTARSTHTSSFTDKQLHSCQLGFFSVPVLTWVKQVKITQEMANTGFISRLVWLTKKDTLMFNLTLE